MGTEALCLTDADKKLLLAIWSPYDLVQIPVDLTHASVLDLEEWPLRIALFNIIYHDFEPSVNDLV